MLVTDGTFGGALLIEWDGGDGSRAIVGDERVGGRESDVAAATPECAGASLQGEFTGLGIKAVNGQSTEFGLGIIAVVVGTDTFFYGIAPSEALLRAQP